MTAVPAARIPEGMDFATARRDSLVRYLRQHVSGEVRFDDTSRGLYSTDASHYQVQPARRGAPQNDRRPHHHGADRVRAERADHRARRRDESVRPVHRPRHRHRLLEVPERGRRSGRVRSARARPTGRGPRSFEPRARHARADLRAGRGDREPRDTRRDDRQQLRRRALRRVQADRRSRPLAVGRTLRRHARRVRPAHRARVRAQARTADARGRRLPRRRFRRARQRRRDRRAHAEHRAEGERVQPRGARGANPGRKAGGG